MSCYNCDGRVEKFVAPMTIKWCGTKVVVPRVERWRCVSCGEEVFDPRQNRKFIRIRQIACLQTAHLSGEQIAKIRREKLKLSQADLEKLLGMGSKLLTRWEQGHTDLSGAINLLFRILDKNPNLIELAYTPLDAPKKKLKAFEAS